MKPIVIFGAGDIAELAHFYFSTEAGRTVAAFTVDRDFLPSGQEICGLPVVPWEDVDATYPPEDHDLFVAVSYAQLNQLRAAKVAEARSKGYTLSSYVSRRATILTQYPIGENAFILEDNTIQPFVRIGRNVTLWSGNHIGHHAVIEDDCFITSHVVISGGVRIGARSFIGVNSTLRDHITIGEDCIVGAGSILLASAEPKSVFRAEGTHRSPVPSNRLRSF